MVVRTIDLETVTLVPDHLWMEQAADMNLFTITEQSIHFRDLGDHQKGVNEEENHKRDDDNLLSFPPPDAHHLCHHFLQALLL